MRLRGVVVDAAVESYNANKIVRGRRRRCHRCAAFEMSAAAARMVDNNNN